MKSEYYNLIKQKSHMKIFAAALIGIVALAEAKGGVAKTAEGRLAESYNHHRAECNANTDRPDGI